MKDNYVGEPAEKPSAEGCGQKISGGSKYSNEGIAAWGGFTSSEVINDYEGEKTVTLPEVPMSSADKGE